MYFTGRLWRLCKRECESASGLTEALYEYKVLVNKWGHTDF